MASVETLMPDSLDIREVFFTNMLLLGFEPEAYDAKFGIPFNRDMFAVPNKKASGIVLHFLFTKLCKEAALEKFRGCWPILDLKQEQAFRKVCVYWITDISKEDADAHLPRIQPSLFLSPGGEKFYTFLLYFSTYVLRQRMATFRGKYGRPPTWPALSAANKRLVVAVCKALDVRHLLECEKLATSSEECSTIQQEWIDFSREVNKERIHLSRQKRTMEKKLIEMQKEFKEILGNGLSSSQRVLQRTQDLNKVRQGWKEITDVYSSGRSLEDAIKQIDDTGIQLHILHGDSIKFKIPDVLVRECEKQLQVGKRYSSVYENGKINLLSLVRLWNLSLHMIKEQLASFPLPDVGSDEVFVRQEAHKHAGCLAALNALRNSVADETIPKLKCAITELSAKPEETLLMKSSSSAQLRDRFGLSMLPTTPPVQFDPATDRPTLEGAPPVCDAMQMPRDYADTPDAVGRLLKEIRGDVLAVKRDGTPLRGAAIGGSSAKYAVTSAIRGLDNGVSGRNPDAIKVNRDHIRPVARSKIPITRPVATQHDGLTSASDASKRQSTSQKNLLSATATKVQSVTRKNTSAADLTRGQEILINDIVTSVMSRSQVDQSSGSSTPDDLQSTPEVHFLNEPLQAFGKEAFSKGDKVPRTPAIVKHRERLSYTVREDSLAADSKRFQTLTDSAVNWGTTTAVTNAGSLKVTSNLSMRSSHSDTQFANLGSEAKNVNGSSAASNGASSDADYHGLRVDSKLTAIEDIRARVQSLASKINDHDLLAGRMIDMASITRQLEEIKERAKSSSSAGMFSAFARQGSLSDEMVRSFSQSKLPPVNDLAISPLRDPVIPLRHTDASLIVATPTSGSPYPGTTGDLLSIDGIKTPMLQKDDFLSDEFLSAGLTPAPEYALAHRSNPVIGSSPDSFDFAADDSAQHSDGWSPTPLKLEVVPAPFSFEDELADQALGQLDTEIPSTLSAKTSSDIEELKRRLDAIKVATASGGR